LTSQQRPLTNPFADVSAVRLGSGQLSEPSRLHPAATADGMTPPPAGASVDSGDDESGAFVFAQRVHTDPVAASGFGDARARLWV